MFYNCEDYPKIRMDLMAKIPIAILKLILIAKDEDPNFWRYTSLKEVVTAMNKNKDLKNRILARLHADETRFSLN